ncbi:Ferrichrome-iron receptor [Granulicella sibirica]|uniref:Ferrichrome-iron receptor n=1 Tax=Granulicella sibirica TaxID=2479048 RepID=A0A4Q0TAJ5_9BACT|nr:Ferrichrome-iron receptor [Granulicella sibirica]
MIRAAVEARCGNTVLNGITGDDGQLKLTLRPGQYRVTVRVPGFTDNSQVTALGAETLTVALAVGSATDTVNVTADTGFVPYASNAGSKTNALLIEVPQSISIINQREMEARNVITVNEALRYTPGIQADEFGVEPRFDWLKIRGFAAETFGVFRDGMRFNSLAGKLDPYELESVEVLRGPSSILYGEVPPGGLINQVTKRPGAERSTEIGMQFGSYDRRQVEADTTGSIDRQQVWRYRLLGLLRDSGTQTNFTPDNRRLIAPSLSWHPSDRTNLTVLSDWQHDGTRWSQFLPSSGTLYNNNPNGLIPLSVFLGEPSFDKVKRDQASIGYTGDHLFTDGWNLHSNYRYQYINVQGSTVYGNGFDTTIPGNTTLVSRSAYALPSIDRINTVDIRALRRFTTANWEQTVLFGYDYAHVDIKTQAGSASVADINIYNPVYGQATIPPLFFYQDNDSLLQQHGLYAQDQIKYKQHIVFTLGGRQDFAKNDISNFLAGGTNFAHTDTRFTGRWRDLPHRQRHRPLRRLLHELPPQRRHLRLQPHHEALHRPGQARRRSPNRSRREDPAAHLEQLHHRVILPDQPDQRPRLRYRLQLLPVGRSPLTRRRDRRHRQPHARPQPPRRLHPHRHQHPQGPDRRERRQVTPADSTQPDQLPRRLHRADQPFRRPRRKLRSPLRRNQRRRQRQLLLRPKLRPHRRLASLQLAQDPLRRQRNQPHRQALHRHLLRPELLLRRLRKKRHRHRQVPLLTASAFPNHQEPGCPTFAGSTIVG